MRRQAKWPEVGYAQRASGQPERQSDGTAETTRDDRSAEDIRDVADAAPERMEDAIDTPSQS